MIRSPFFFTVLSFVAAGALAFGVAVVSAITIERRSIEAVNEVPEISRIIEGVFDMRPAAIEKRLKLRNPIYSETAAYGHMGRRPRTVTKHFEQSWAFPLNRSRGQDRRYRILCPAG